MKYSRLFVFAILAMFMSASHADYFGLANGRTANNDNMANLSVEAGGNFAGDARILGGRVNYKVGPDLMLFGELGQAEFLFGSSGFVYGFGAYYQLRSVTLLENTDFGVKASYHGGNLEYDGCSDIGLFGIRFDCPDYSASEITLEAHISGDQLGETDFAWYGNAGFHILDLYSRIGFGGGIVGDLGFGNWYAGVDYINAFSIVGGIRYNLN